MLSCIPRRAGQPRNTSMISSVEALSADPAEQPLIVVAAVQTHKSASKIHEAPLAPPSVEEDTPSRDQEQDQDFVFVIPPPPFFEGTRAKFDATLESCWYGRVLLLFRIRVKTDEKDRNSRSVLKDCNCAMIDCLYDYAPGCR
jgi:hypothetical protein